MPNSRSFKDGDWTNFDITCFKDGYFGDTSIMIEIGKVDAEVSRMVYLKSPVDKDSSAGSL